MSSKSKFLVLNPSPGNLDNVLEKANLQNTRNGPFEAVLLLGDVIPANLQVPQTKLDAPAYFSKGKLDIGFAYEEDEATNLVDLDKNLTYMKRPLTIYKLATGITIAFMSAEAEKEPVSTEVKEQLQHTSPVDILITYSWPYVIAREEKLSTVGNRFVDQVTERLQPRYQFAVGNERGKFFEFKPFKWDNTDRITRFISLGQEGSGDKWFYAFGLDIKTINVDVNLGVNPFAKVVEPPKRSIEKVEEPDQEVQTIKKPRIVNPDQCFFCLSNPKVETHMIISIGTNAYLTVAKGPLTRPSKNLKFSGHAIIIPIEHIPTIRKTSTNVIESAVYQEIEQYKKSLVRAFLEQKPQFRLVFFEINRLDNIHQHIQVLPIPSELVDTQFPKALEEKARINNEEFNKNHKLNFLRFDNDSDDEFKRIITSSDYISFTIYTGENEKIHWISEINEAKPVDLQFPRRVLAFTLKCPKRLYWDKCQQPKFKETTDCEEFKFFYKNYDFTA